MAPSVHHKTVGIRLDPFDKVLMCVDAQTPILQSITLEHLMKVNISLSEIIVAAIILRVLGVFSSLYSSG